MNAALDRRPIARPTDPAVQIAELVTHFDAIAHELPREIPKIYAEALSQHWYIGGWSSSPPYEANSYAEYAAGGGVGFGSERSLEVYTIGSNRLWRVIDDLCSVAQERYTRVTGNAVAPGTHSQLVAGITLTMSDQDGCSITIYGGKNRANLRGEQTYDDKFIELSHSDNRFRIRAVDSRGEGKATEGTANVATLMPAIHRALLSGEVKVTIDLFDRGLTTNALRSLGSRLMALS